LGTSEFDAAIAKGYTYYRANFFIEDLPTYKPRVKYPIDTHAAAHAIITLREFGDSSHARHIADWMCKNMQSPQGYFYYQRHSRYTNKIPYIRWSNAWMFLALCTVLNSEKG